MPRTASIIAELNRSAARHERPQHVEREYRRAQLREIERRRLQHDKVVRLWIGDVGDARRARLRRAEHEASGVPIDALPAVRRAEFERRLVRVRLHDAHRADRERAHSAERIRRTVDRA